MRVPQRRKRQFGNEIKFVGHFKQTFFIANRTGKRTFNVTEQFRLKQVVIERGTVLNHKSFVFA